ncbi:translesion DNA synthesis-associated protein ImuA [Sedimenticola sp.]|uniref:translesion DNA synthesis-associated protein ImuA n=1 Tax=Sedimenticola sp. TaxID=1940285 RepID=UPI002589EAE4|nr:translesion DNA synthesis-associated protein ImuA [Sedimenticola sp.]MCW8905258.1 translesion DNA synthesis-associated protein ImuA [Sedimenticola sp.]
MILEEILSSVPVWRGDKLLLGHQPKTLSSGYTDLDTLLAGGGWPGAALTELLLDHHGIGELSLLRPLLGLLGQTGKPAVWISPPYIPYAPALRQARVSLDSMRWISPDTVGDAAWVAEQCLRSGSCGAVLFWPKAINTRILRRLQLAAEQGECPGFLFRPRAAASQSSPAALRLLLSAQAQGLGVELLKCRGRRPGAHTCLAV